MLRPLSLLLAAGIVAVAGCGGGDGDAGPEADAGEPAIAALVDDLVDAYTTGEPAKLCAALSERLLAELGASREQCRSDIPASPAWRCTDCTFRTERVVSLPGRSERVVWLLAVEAIRGSRA